jgi:transposase-like protein
MSEEIIALYLQGKKPAEIAKLLQIDRKYVAKVIINYLELQRLNKGI